MLASQRPKREDYFNLGAVAKEEKGFKLEGPVPRFQGTSQFCAKRWGGTVEWENISNLLSVDR